MTIRSILVGRERNIISGDLDQSVQDALELLAQNRIGAIPILSESQVVGIFSERDLVRLISSYGAQVLERKLADVMTQSPVIADIDMPIIAALSLMTRKRIRHLPVLDAGDLAGFVSIGDLVKYRIDGIEAEANAMRAYIAS